MMWDRPQKRQSVSNAKGGKFYKILRKGNRSPEYATTVFVDIDIVKHTMF